MRRVSIAAVLAAALLSVAGNGCGAESGNDSEDPDRPPAASTAPAPPPNTPPAPEPDWDRRAERVVRQYYRALNRGSFNAAWERLSEQLQARLGPFETWRSGYSFTEGTDPRSVRVLRADESAAQVALTLISDDVDACGDHVSQRFDGSWALERVAGRYIATGIQFAKVSGAEPVREVANCPEYLPVEPPDEYVPPPGITIPEDDGAPYVTGPDFCDYHDCIPNFDNGTGYPVQCADGTWSGSGGRSGACSWHGGVR